jgi:hypothetical protein
LSNRRDLQLDSYEISKYAYRELFNFCRQYPDKKAKLRDLRSLSIIPMSGMPHGSGASTPTESKGMLAAKISTDCELIEQTAIEADAEIYSWLIKNVSEEGLTWEYLNPPKGRRQFYESRRRFFYLLAYKKGML